MDEIDRKLLNSIQSDFPIDPLPYRVLGERLGITETEVLSRVHALIDTEIIRKIGASFDTRKLEHESALVAAKVPTERLDEVAAAVSSFPEVTHNYGRGAEYNLWFAIVCSDSSMIGDVVDRIRLKTGVSDMHILPAEKMFKIKVQFEF